ncbi:starch phosphorylase [Lebetimonas natsushimae]|uniref:Starch phosphorylase n=1 Tax=Lebetimonas natsushimae TaxID=1936991 RepID=A0A292Y9A1_9BACT|nr:alpha-glucan family phosphorylase [Lebetimonas natsushimae]GAX87452.1 starch phosphorylase [Lebetimonas natsushimae]
MKTKNILLENFPKELENLKKIALNLWWSWNPRARELFKIIDPFLWEYVNHNPIALLNSLNDDDYKNLINNHEFMKEYHLVSALFKDYLNSSKIYTDENTYKIAYFCAEFGLHHSLPIYSGGLGFLAGDVLKESSDMNIPMVGIGFMYSNGYVKQVIGSDGWQHGENQPINKDEAPIERVLDKNGNHLIIQVPFIDPPIYTAVWKVNVGKIELYLLDTDIEQNSPWDRGISSHLYTPDMQQRLRQQIVLGIGGYAVLETLGIKYSILHLNEGHPAFALFERIRYFINQGLSKEEAIKKVKSTSIFTTHTPLAAATDVYSFENVGNYFKDYVKNIKMDLNEFFSFGINPDDPHGFNMTILAMNLSDNINAVSKKHKIVTENIWKNFLIKTDKKIDYVTNGVHIPTWINEDLYKMYDELIGNWLEIQDDANAFDIIDDIDDKKLWKMHKKYKKLMVDFINKKAQKKWESGADPLVVIAEGALLDNDILTVTFARRMTGYKRPDLILKDLDRLYSIIHNPRRPIQIIFSGKAHPADTPGKQIIQRIFKVCEDPKSRGRIAFVEDYNEEVAKYLIRGSDIWLNNPRLPLEASGTSGMKAEINGNVHLSSLDGWWPEGFNGKNGFTIGGEISDDEKDAQSIYENLERIANLYYDRDDLNYPKKWIQIKKEAIKSVTPNFSARRMMKDYLNKFYLKISSNLRRGK